jgi:hypothetical protein
MERPRFQVNIGTIMLAVGLAGAPCVFVALFRNHRYAGIAFGMIVTSGAHFLTRIYLESRRPKGRTPSWGELNRVFYSALAVVFVLMLTCVVVANRLNR